MLFSLQALRALAAWVVVCHHFVQIFFDFHPTGPVSQLLTDRGAVGVDVFFVISGLVIYLSTQDKDIPARQFLLNRLFRIVPAYWFYSAIMGLMILCIGYWLPHQAVDLPHFLLSLLFIPSENPGGYGLYPTLNVGWTLNYEMLFYLLFALVFWAPRRHRAMLLGVALLGVSEGLARFGLISRFYGNDIIYEFLLGVAIGVLYRRGWVIEGLWLPLLALSGALIALYRLDASERFLHWGLPSAVLVLACVALEPYFRASWLARPLKALGDSSYSVYLLHVLVLYGGWLASQHFDLNPYLTFATCVPLIAALAWVSYELLEKRLYHRLRQRFERSGAGKSVAPLT